MTFEGSELFVVVYYWDERCSGFAVFDDAAAKFVVVDFGVYEVGFWVVWVEWCGESDAGESIDGNHGKRRQR